MPKIILQFIFPFSETESKEIFLNLFSQTDHNRTNIVVCEPVQFTEQNYFAFELRNLQLLRVKRPPRDGHVSVTDQKFAFRFQLKSKINSVEIVFNTISLPIVVIVHGNQEPKSWATITWNNALLAAGYQLFEIASIHAMPWKWLVDALKMKFKTQTKLEFTEDNASDLCKKMFSPKIDLIIILSIAVQFCLSRKLVSPTGDEWVISWPNFCKSNLPGRNFTFWQWFYAAMKLTKEHFQELWTRGCIYGFISKERTKRLLTNSNNGTFLIRFSESVLGELSFTHLLRINLSNFICRERFDCIRERCA